AAPPVVRRGLSSGVEQPGRRPVGIVLRADGPDLDDDFGDLAAPGTGGGNLVALLLQVHGLAPALAARGTAGVGDAGLQAFEASTDTTPWGHRACPSPCTCSSAAIRSVSSTNSRCFMPISRTARVAPNRTFAGVGGRINSARFFTASPPSPTSSD